jgi:hypothetical protein
MIKSSSMFVAVTAFTLACNMDFMFVQACGFMFSYN